LRRALQDSNQSAKTNQPNKKFGLLTNPQLLNKNQKNGGGRAKTVMA